MSLLLSFSPQKSITLQRAIVARISSRPIGSKQGLLKKFFSSNSSSSDTSTSDNPLIIHHLPNGIKHVELNRPDKLNALNLSLFQAIAKAAQEIRQDSSARAVILSGRGRAFCSGLDVMSMIKPSKEDGIFPTNKIDKLLVRPSGYERQEGEGRKGCGEGEGDGDSTVGGNDVDLAAVEDLYRSSALGNLAQDVAYLWRNIPVPVIAVLDGICFGGGLQIALGADMRYSTKDCRLSGE